MPAADPSVAPGQLSGQARAEQLEAALAESHALLNRLHNEAEAEPGDVAQGAVAALDRCLDRAHILNNRLEGLVSEIGLL